MSSLRPASATPFATSGYCARPGEPEPGGRGAPSPHFPADRDLSAQAPIAEYIGRSYPSITIVKASDGDEASKALEDHPVGIALIDRCLPGLDGADFVRELRKRATLFGLLSDRLVPRWARVAQAIGAYDVLLKPLRPAQVDNFLAAWNRTCQPANVLLVESSQKTLDVVARLLRQSSFKLNLDFFGHRSGDAQGARAGVLRRRIREPRPGRWQWCRDRSPGDRPVTEYQDHHV